VPPPNCRRGARPEVPGVPRRRAPRHDSPARRGDRSCQSTALAQCAVVHGSCLCSHARTATP
jgi:hypothetical protein